MEGQGGGGGTVPLVDGLPATYNQSCAVQIAVGGMAEEAVAYQIDVQSTLAPEPWSVTATYEDFKMLRKSLVSDFDMKVVSGLDFPGDKKDKLLAKANQAAKKDTSAAALKQASKRVGELEGWLTLVLCYCPDVAALDAFLQMSMHINPTAASTAPAPAVLTPINAAAPNDDPWAHEGVPPQSTTDPWGGSTQHEAASAAGSGANGMAAEGGMALVVQDYSPSFDGAVAVVTDEVVTILDDSSPEWWLVRTSDGREGAVPSAFLELDEGGFGSASVEAQFASAATFATGAVAAPAPAPLEERILMILQNEHVEFSQKLKTSVTSLGELEEIVQQRLELQFAVNLWCALPGGNSEPERVTDLGALPMLAKVYVRPEQINLIAVVHNGDLEHIMAMEVADVAEVAECIKSELHIVDFDGAAITVLDTDGNSAGSRPLTALDQLQYDIHGRAHLGLEALGDGAAAQIAVTTLLEHVAAMPERFATESQRAAAKEAAGQLRAMLAA